MRLSRVYIYIFIAINLIGVNLLKANSNVIILTDSTVEEALNPDRLFYFIDTTNSLTINSIESEEFQQKFTTASFKALATTVPQITYWLKFTVRNETSQKHWLLESFNYRVDSIILYEKNDENKLLIHYGGSAIDFNNRFLNHKNIIFSLDIKLGEEKTYYIKVRTTQSTSIEFIIRSLDFFTSYALNEYLFLGMFYGALILIIIANIFLLFALKRTSILFYILYVLSSLVFFSCQDGIGFQYLWPSNPEFNYHAYSISLVAMTIFLLLYTSFFSRIFRRYRWVRYSVYCYIIYRIVVQLIITIFFPEIKHFIYTDILPFIYAFLLTFFSFKKGNRSVIYFTISQTIMIIVIVIYSLRMFGVIGSGIFIFYSFNFAVILEMLFLSFAFAQRVRELNVKKRLHKQLKALLNAKLKEYDDFLYRSSHDIKGPVKTIMGLANLALIEDKNNKDEYFKMISKVATNLDNVTTDISHISHINNAEIKAERINFKDLIKELEELYKEPEHINFIFKDTSEAEVVTDKYLFFEILRNLIDNIIKYRSEGLKRENIELEVSSRRQKITVRIIDKTNCIPYKNRENAFNIFFRLNNNNYGIGLYISKIASEKLKGTIAIDHRNKEETIFVLTISNLRIKK